MVSIWLCLCDLCSNLVLLYALVNLSHDEVQQRNCWADDLNVQSWPTWFTSYFIQFPTLKQESMNWDSYLNSPTLKQENMNCDAVGLEWCPSLLYFHFSGHSSRRQASIFAWDRPWLLKIYWGLRLHHASTSKQLKRGEGDGVERMVSDFWLCWYIWKINFGSTVMIEYIWKFKTQD